MRPFGEECHYVQNPPPDYRTTPLPYVDHVSNQTRPSLSPTVRPGALHPSMRNSGIVNNVDAQTIEFDEALLIEGYLEQAEEALQLAEEAMHAVFEADSLLS